MQCLLTGSHSVSKKKEDPKNARGLNLHKSEATLLQKKKQNPKIVRGSAFTKAKPHFFKKKQNPKNVRGSAFAKKRSHHY
jgi:hypothetical protein